MVWSFCKDENIHLFYNNRIINTFYQEMDLHGVKFNQGHSKESKKIKKNHRVVS